MIRIFFIFTLMISPFVNAGSVPDTQAGTADESQTPMRSSETKPAESLIALPVTDNTETKMAEPAIAPEASVVPALQSESPKADAPKVQKKVRVQKKPVEQTPEEIATPPVAAPSVEPTPIVPDPVVSPTKKSRSKKNVQVAPLVREDVVVQSVARYVQGEGPLAKRTKINLFVTDKGVELVPENTRVEAWKIPIEKVRGANGAKEGLWLYWFDDQDVTHSAYIETVEDQVGLTSAINKMVVDFHHRPTLESEKLKEDFEKYRQEALKEAQ